MNQNKKIIISLGIVFSLILLSISILKISINILYPGNELSNSLKDSFKDIFGKAIKFDSLHFKYNGDIVLRNFYLSNTNDFNDNINLIKCKEITIDTYLIDLIRKKVTVSGIYMVEPEISILKNFGKTYYETLIDEMIGGINKEKIRQFITDGFRFELTESNLSFRETFRNSKSGLDFYNFDLKIKYKNDYISYRTYGSIHDKLRNSWFKRSSFKSKGKIYLDKMYSEGNLELNNFDLAHLNNLLNDRFSFRTLVTGVFSGDIKFISENDIVKCKGEAGVSSFNLFYYEKDKPYTLLKNEDIDTKFNFNLSKNFDRLIVDKFYFDDGIIEISSNMEFVKDDYILLQLKSNKVDLDDLSDKIYLFKNCRYSGNALFNGVCRYNLKDGKPETLNFNFMLNKFNIYPLKDNSGDYTDIKDGNISLTADKDKITIKTNFKSGNSDFDILYYSLISSWNPLKSSNRFEVFSKKIEFDLLKYMFAASIKKAYNMAYVDMFQNFDEQRNFLKEPEGILINDNDISLKIHADKLIVAGKSHLNNLNLDLSLNKGVLKTNNFSLEGYNGIYSFNLYSSLHQDYPFFKFDAEAKDLDLNRISDDSGLKYSFGGKLTADINFETSAYRIGQVVENGKAGFNITIKDGYLNNTPIQNKLNGFMSQNNYRDLFNRKIDFSSFSISFMQSANNFYIKNFTLNSPNLNFNAFGNYTEEDGLIIPLTLNIFNEKISDRAPLEIYGSIETPCLKIKSKSKTGTICF